MYWGIHLYEFNSYTHLFNVFAFFITCYIVCVCLYVYVEEKLPPEFSVNDALQLNGDVKI